jgi:hypothetical protein
MLKRVKIRVHFIVSASVSNKNWSCFSAGEKVIQEISTADAGFAARVVQDALWLERNISLK